MCRFFIVLVQDWRTDAASIVVGVSSLDGEAMGLRFLEPKSLELPLLSRQLLRTRNVS